MKLILVNHTAWPTAALKIIGKWVCRRAGITWKYQITVGNSSRGWHGRGWQCSQNIYLSRRYRPRSGFPYSATDTRIKDAPTHTIRSRLELLVYLMAHEACHANEGQSIKYKNPVTSRVDRQSMEYDCNLFAIQTVEAFREEWKALRVKIVDALRGEREKRSPDSKLSKRLEQARDSLTAWERKLKLASTKVKKYRQKLRYYEGKAAASRGKDASGAESGTIDQSPPQ